MKSLVHAMSRRTCRPLLILAGTFLLILVAEWLLRRVESEQLFLFGFPVDRSASRMEQMDAVRSAKMWHLPAIASLLVLGGLGLCWKPGQTLQEHKKTGSVFDFLLVFAVIADLASTLWFFHTKSIELEVHPGIRLFGYAFGRTAGPVLAKAVQLAGILLVGHLWPKWRTQVFAIASVLMLVASAHNMLNSF